MLSMENEWQELYSIYESGTPLVFVEAVDQLRASTGVRRTAMGHQFIPVVWEPGRTQAEFFGKDAPKAWQKMAGPFAGTSGDINPALVLDAWSWIPWEQETRPIWLIVDGIEHYWRHPAVMYAALRLQAQITNSYAHVMCVFIITDATKLPVELAHVGPVVRVTRPGRDEAVALLKGLLRKNPDMQQTPLTEAQWHDLADAVAGMTGWEIYRAGAASLQALNRLDAEFLAKHKGRAIAQGGVLELVEAADSLDSIGGLDALKKWALVRRRAFGTEAAAYGLPTPKGVLAIGPPGTGKSLFAKALSAAWKFPLLRLDFGRIFGPYVGQSEAQLRDALAQAEAHAPVVLWIDEIEKGMAGSTGPSGDSGTARRILGSFLTWMQEKSAPVFIVATANDISGLPPEFLRKGRFDEIFFIDLPNARERESIWRLHLSKRHIDPATVPLAELVDQTENFTGAEIEQSVIDALYQAFAEDRKPQLSDWREAIHEARPIARVMAERIQELRQWAQQRARPASGEGV